MALTNNLRAAVFARDKAVCAFSGVSVWILDHGTAPFAQHDWADHVRPRSRKGKDTVDNLVCASHFYNGKKVDNGRDNTYLFRAGQPTYWFFWVHGELSVEQAEMLKRHAAITAHDWYFNRCLSNVMTALFVRWNERAVVRGPDYWLKAALGFLATWRRLSGEVAPDTFLRRGLVRYPEAPDVKLMLEIAGSDPDGLRRIFDRLTPYYDANAGLLESFASAEQLSERVSILRQAEASGEATEPTLNIMRRNLERLSTMAPA